VIGTLAVDGWVVTFCAAMMDLGRLRPAKSPPRCECNSPPAKGQ